jgi:hypothetical protein
MIESGGITTRRKGGTGLLSPDRERRDLAGNPDYHP